MGFSKLTKFYVVNVWFMDDCVGGGRGGGGGSGGEGGGRSGVGRYFALVSARICSCDLNIGYKKLQLLKPLFVYLRSLGVLKNLFKWIRALIQIESKFVGF